MDVDFLAKGKGKGKQDIGKGKGKSKGRDKGRSNWNNSSSYKSSWNQQSRLETFANMWRARAAIPQSALEFWKKEHRREKAEKEASRKRPMEDSEALSEKKLQEIAKAGARNTSKATMSASGTMTKTTV